MKKIQQTLLSVMLSFFALTLYAQPRQHQLIDDGWHFAFGHAADPARDFGCGTEYFNYLTKANSIHNEGPYAMKFKEDSTRWTRVDLPHDWVVQLPFARGASHSHGYKTVGWKYPETSVGWYRRFFNVDKSEDGQHFELQFDGIFRDARIWVNGFYVGGEPSGYIPQTFDITEYLNYGGSNLICVRVDASLEEGWFYEGAGIYRHVWLNRTAPVYVKTDGTFVHADLQAPFDRASLTIETTVCNDAYAQRRYTLSHELLDADGKVVASVAAPGSSASAAPLTIQGKDEQTITAAFEVAAPHLWSLQDPYLYKVRTRVIADDGAELDEYVTPFGFRHIAFDPDSGFLLNGKSVKLKGFDMHQDLAGVGSAIPDDLIEWEMRQLQSIGANAVRTSHNPATPALLDACDRLGILILEENRLTGVNDYQRHQLERMICRDRNHPCIILWSIGNEEWGIEWKDYGRRIGAAMREFCHRLDPTRPACAASSSGPTILEPMDVAGYNYILQNPVEEHRKNYPQRCAVGTEETTGCGTRGIYFDERRAGRMAAINRRPEGRDSMLNCIERGWQFYHQRPWLGGVFYWTGFDYRGEPNPLSFPATGSEFGVLDYAGFPKDEAFYLKSWWTDEPVLHLLPHWNLSGHEGEQVDVWAYSNCAEVELIVNGKKQERKAMPRDGHLSWTVTYQPGAIEARGYDVRGKRVCTERLETTDQPSRIQLSTERCGDVYVCTIALNDRRGRFVPTACEDVQLTIDGDVRFLGVGNGDPAWQASEQPIDPAASHFQVGTFNGLARVFLQRQPAATAKASASLTVTAVGATATVQLK